ncbi:TIR domain-containing protein [Paenibacillus thermotolerans]|uniref:TIR domain-containing protein n=1 Tax=Paenibacillus thermotolerans TaxID=3027807 RepID=UPI002368EB97|nr:MULTISPECIES: TIR domain-containing protein [unclassified Paenibacillus]
MVRQVFYSFHYEPDSVRASQVRNMGVIEGNQPARDNDWETIKRGGKAAIQRWIDSQLHGRSCTVVLIGENTAGREWINYEISKSWNDNKGVLGIHIHNLKDFSGNQSRKGNNPFDYVVFTESQRKLSTVVHTYDPPYRESKDVYSYIKDNLPGWIEKAIALREKY